MVRSRHLHALGLLAALGMLARCVPQVDQRDRPCPCSSPYRCCEAAQVCVPEEDSCPASSEDGGAGVSSKGGSGGGGGGVSGGGHGGTIITVGGNSKGGASNEGPAGAGAGGAAGEGGAAGAASCDITPESCAGYGRKSNVLVLFYNPILKSGDDIRKSLGVFDGRTLSARLASQIRAASGGVINYELVEAREIPDFPPQRPGTMPLNAATWDTGVYDKGGVGYLNYVEGKDGTAEGALNADYNAIFEDQDVCNVVKAKNISEVWLWGAHNGPLNFGFEYFSYRLAGDALPEGATEADLALYKQRRRNIPDCGRTLFVLGAQYSEGNDAAGNAHRSYNFRAQELLELALRTQSADTVLGRNVWQQFSQFQLAGSMNAQVGTPSYPPNASVDEAGQVMSAQPWDYTNLVNVLSGADRWIAYPDLSAKPRELNCTGWACTNEGFQYWYARHIPHGDGIAPSGSCVNWWQYIADPKLELEPCCGEDCHPLARIGQACASDAECASGHCACAGKAVCVNEAVEPCGRTNWSLCAANEDCESKICGCAGSNLPQCLPVGSRSGCN